jgi:hypothetical protein
MRGRLRDFFQLQELNKWREGKTVALIFFVSFEKKNEARGAGLPFPGSPDLLPDLMLPVSDFSAPSGLSTGCDGGGLRLMISSCLRRSSSSWRRFSSFNSNWTKKRAKFQISARIEGKSAPKFKFRLETERKSAPNLNFDSNWTKKRAKIQI